MNWSVMQISLFTILQFNSLLIIFFSEKNSKCSCFTAQSHGFQTFCSHGLQCLKRNLYPFKIAPQIYHFNIQTFQTLGILGIWVSLCIYGCTFHLPNPKTWHSKLFYHNTIIYPFSFIKIAVGLLLFRLVNE